MRKKAVRIVLLGDFGVGKTSLFRQFLDRKFVDGPSNTIVEDERMKTIKVNDKEIDLLITDTAGQEQFRSFTSSYFREKDGFLVVFSVADKKSFDNLGHWIKEAKSWDESTRVCVVGNKIDVDDKQRVVSVREAEEFVASLGSNVVYMETSAKLNINCAKVFEEIARACHVQETPVTPTTAPAPVVNLRAPEQQPEQRNFVCCN